MHPYIILIESQLSENIGMTARAMMNCGLENLRLVNPKEDHLSAKAISASSGADEILQNAKVFSSTADAISDLNFVLATTARIRNQVKPIYSAPYAGKELFKKQQENLSCGLIFGPERTGLHNDDICLANGIINIPLNPKHCSLNLSQAVLLVGYEYYKNTIEQNDIEFLTNDGQIADKDKVFRFLDHLEDLVKDCGNFKIKENKERMNINLKNIFTRNLLTEQELNTLYGIFKHLNKK